MTYTNFDKLKDTIQGISDMNKTQQTTVNPHLKTPLRGVAKIPSNGFTFYIDPLRAHLDMPVNTLMEWCGLIPNWFRNVDEYENLETCLIESYGFYMAGFDGVINDEGVYTSPYKEDSDLNPIVMAKHKGEIFFQYDHGIVAVIRTNGTQFISRMD